MVDSKVLTSGVETVKRWLDWFRHGYSSPAYSNYQLYRSKRGIYVEIYQQVLPFSHL